VLLRLVSVTPPLRWLWLLPVAGLAGVVAADLASGLVHWFADTYFDPRTPVVGPLLIEPFREHHRDPEGIAHHGFLELSGNNALVTLPLAGALLWAGEPGDELPGQVLHAFVATLALALFSTNLFHAWAHHPDPPRLAQGLQRARLVLPPAVHARHHRGDHDASYCVTGGWLNPLLDRLRLFARLERGLARVGIGRQGAGARVRARARAGAP
jgi:ubiquitin-conjugating enzyme E2 variant